MKKYWIALLGILLISFVSAVPSPHAFYGDVNYSNGESVQEGTIIAMIDESLVGVSDIINGVYDLTVESEYGGLIYFYIEGLQEPLANYIFNSFEITKLDFEIPVPEPEPEPDDEPKSHSHTSNIKHFCEVSWKCGGWSSCDNGIMTRTCYDTNHCDYSYNTPNEIASCVITEKALVDEGNYNQILVFLVLFTIILSIVLLAILVKR